MISINSSRVILRLATLRDRHRIYKWLALSDITPRMLGAPNFTDNPVPSWQQFLSDYDVCFFTGEPLENGRSFIIEVSGFPVGHINYNKIDRTTNTVELDIWLAAATYCERGYGTESIAALCEYLAKKFDCKRFVLAPSARNEATVKAYRKCGFEQTKELPVNFVPDYYDSVVMIKIIS